MQLRPVRATDVYRLQLVTRTEQAPCWIAEVENWVARDSWYWFRDPANQPARLWLAESDGDVTVVAAAQRIAGHVWYVPAVLVDADAQEGRRSSACRDRVEVRRT